MKRGVLYAMTAILATAVCLPASATTLDTALNKMAGKIKKYLVANRIQDITINDFDGPLESSAGKLISNTLTDKLKAKEVKVTPFATSRHQIKGNFAYDKDPNADLGVLLIAAELADGNGKDVQGFRQRVEVEQVTELSDIANLLGVTVDLTAATDSAEDDSASEDAEPSRPRTKAIPASTPAVKKKKLQAERSKLVEQSRDKPSFTLVSQSKVSASEKSPFRVELFVKKPGGGFEPLEIGDLGGFAFAPLQKDDIYAVRIHNSAPHDVSVELAIDGVNTLALTQVEAYGHGRWIVPAGGAIQINGWHIRDNLQESFLVTSDEKGVAKLIGAPTAQIGTITTSFFHAWAEGEPIPEIERSLGTARSLGGLATGRGPATATRSQRVFRNMGKQLLASVSIRYENPEPDDLPDDAPPIN